MNLNELDSIASSISKYDIYRWKIFRFQPLRNKAKENRVNYEITDQEFEKKVKSIQEKNKKMKIETRDKKDFEELYLNITPNGDFVITNDYNDKKICSYKDFDFKKVKNVLEIK